jgi:hypothetical protein
VVVLELMLGILIGPHVLGLAHPGDFIEFFSNLGLGMLFFFAGYEIDFERIKGRPMELGAFGWLLSIVLAYGFGGMLAAAGVVVSFLYTGSAMATTAIGTLIPILRDNGELKTRFGTYLLAAGGAGEFGPILLVTLVLSTTNPLHESVILLGFVALAIALALVSVRFAWRGWSAFERTFEASSQLAVRVTVVLVFGLVLLASNLGLDVLLGGFVAGMITRLLRPLLLRHQRHRVRPRRARLGGCARQAGALPGPLPRRPRRPGAAALPRRPRAPRPRRARLLLRHRAAACGGDHDDRDRGRPHAPLDRRRPRRRRHALDPDLSLRRHGSAQGCARRGVPATRAKRTLPGGRGSAAPARARRLASSLPGA